MNTQANIPVSPENPIDGQAAPDAIARLVAQVYASAPVSVRATLLAQLIKPLGVLALVAVANGVFAKIRFKSGWPDMHIRMEDIQNVQPDDVIALVDRLQQVSQSSFDGLARILATNPVLAGSATAAVLLTLLVKHAQHREHPDGWA